MSLSVSNTTDNTFLGRVFMEQQQEWLKAKDVAKILGTTDRTIARLVERGELVAYRIGGVLKFKPIDVQQYLENARTDKQERK